MAIGFTSQADYVTGTTAASAWINQITSLYGFTVLNKDPVTILAQPATPVAGQIYLVLTGATSPLVAGTAVVYLTTSNTSAVTITPPVGTVVGNYVKQGTTWVFGGFVNGCLQIVSTASTVPTTMIGSCEIYATAAVVITAPAGTVAVGFGTTVVGKLYKIINNGVNSWMILVN